MNRTRFFCFVPFLLSACSPGDAVLNELVSKSDVSDDWIEVYNHGAEDMELEGWSLTDDLDAEFFWGFPAVSLASGAFLRVWADDGDSSEGLQTNFKLSKDGESIFLLSPFGRISDTVDFPAMEAEQSYGRSPDGTGDWTVFESSTPEASNG
jgi:hypothetical protein